jgi:hypothetical protein
MCKAMISKGESLWHNDKACMFTHKTLMPAKIRSKLTELEDDFVKRGQTPTIAKIKEILSLICYKCMNTGHWAKDCPESKGPKANVVDVKEEELFQLSHASGAASSYAE